MTYMETSAAYSKKWVEITGANVSSIPSLSARRVQEPVHQWHSVVMDRLNALVKLERGWDGYKGIPVSFENANFALNLLHAACSIDTPSPQIVPGSNGDLQIEWHTEEGDIELHIQAPYKVEAWRSSESTGIDGEEISLTNNFAVVAKWIAEISEPIIAARSSAA